MADPGAVERNVMYADIALQRASQRNGGQSAVPTVPSSVTGADAVPSQAVNTTNPYGGE
jgi:hypothetical protein